MNNFFDQIYVLNLDRRTDRWDAVQKQLHNAGITKAVRFPAIEKKINNSESAHEACFHTHVSAYQKALDTGARNVLIFEDDAALYDDWEPIWKSFKRQIHSDWDIIYLGYNLEHKYQPNLTTPPLITSNVLLLNDVLALHAYAVNGKHLKTLIEHQKSQYELNIPGDVAFAKHNSGFKVYGAYPMLFYQTPGFSDIVGNNVDYKLRHNVDQVLAK
jgi:GR25 family glycosyltransferase involved in LPS biosynthesis